MNGPIFSCKTTTSGKRGEWYYGFYKFCYISINLTNRMTQSQKKRRKKYSAKKKKSQKKVMLEILQTFLSVADHKK